MSNLEACNVPIGLMDIKGQIADVQDEVEAAVLAVVRNGQFILGPNVKALEAEITTYLATAGSVGVANGTDASETLARLRTEEDCFCQGGLACATVANKRNVSDLVRRVALHGYLSLGAHQEIHDPTRPHIPATLLKHLRSEVEVDKVRHSRGEIAKERSSGKCLAGGVWVACRGCLVQQLRHLVA